MSDRFVTIASYAWPPEAQLAKNLLESEGIAAFLAGEEAATTLTRLAGPASEVRLQVREEDAPRAVSLLAAASAEGSLDEDWEAQAERDWRACPVCGTALPTGQTRCPDCGTADDRITTGRGAVTARPPDPVAGKADDRVRAEPPRPAPAVPAGAEASAAPGGQGCAALFLGLPLLALWLLRR
jgi:hypothetical protein